MDESPEDFLKKEEHKRRVKLIKITILILIIFVTPALCLVINKIYLDHKLKAERAKVRESGYPTSFKELEIWYRNGNKFPPEGSEPVSVPDSQNAAVTMEEAYTLLIDDVTDPEYVKPEKPAADDDYEAAYNSNFNKEECLSNKDLIIVGTFQDDKFHLTPIPPEIIKKSSIYLKANEKALKKVEEAMQKPFYRYHKVGGFMSPLSRTLSNNRQVTRLFAMQSTLSFEQNQVDKSIDAIEKGIRFPKMFKKNPYLITYLVNVACVNIIYSNIEHLLNKKQLTEQQLKKLADILSEEPEIKDLLLALYTEIPFMLCKESEQEIGEQLLYTLSFHNFEIATNQKLVPYATFIAKQSGIIAKEQIDCLTATEELCNTEKINGRDLIKKLDIITDKLPSKALSQLKETFEVYKRVVNSYMRNLALYRNLVTAVAVERYHLKYKKLPKTLSELVPEYLPSVPVDPYDGKPLKYSQCTVTKKQAVKMATGKIKKLPDTQKSKKEHSTLLGMFSTGHNKPEKPAYNTPLPGYKIIDIKRNGYMIYSISEDGKDNGGTPKRTCGRNTDITTAVLREGL